MKTVHSVKKLVSIALMALFFVSCPSNIPMATSQEDRIAKSFTGSTSPEV